MALPPPHRVDHQVAIILSFDSCWQKERLDQEHAEIKDPETASQWQRNEDHPWYRYITGESRGDLATVAHYIDEDKGPLRFMMRRLTLRELALLESMTEGTGRLTALSYALTSIEGAQTIKFERDLPRALTEADLQRLREVVGDTGMVELGEQALACSRMELQPAEKKP